ncbi:hypothetical protein CEE97_12195, partial [Lactobacillus crispatus]
GLGRKGKAVASELAKRIVDRLGGTRQIHIGLAIVCELSRQRARLKRISKHDAVVGVAVGQTQHRQQGGPQVRVVREDVGCLAAVRDPRPSHAEPAAAENLRDVAAYPRRVGIDRNAGRRVRTVGAAAGRPDEVIGGGAHGLF